MSCSEEFAVAYPFYLPFHKTNFKNVKKKSLGILSLVGQIDPLNEFLSFLPSSSARNLGVIFDKCFNFEDHIKSICKSSHYHIRNIAKIRKYIDEESAKIVAQAFVTPKLDSCNSLLYGLPQHLISRLQSIQNTAARVVTRTRNFDHISPVLKQLHWPPLRYRIVFKILLLVYKALNGTAPSYISELLKYHTSERKVRSSSQHLLASPKARLKTYGESVCCGGTKTMELDPT